jgi:hypothetical protein
LEDAGEGCVELKDIRRIYTPHSGKEKANIKKIGKI